MSKAKSKVDKETLIFWLKIIGLILGGFVFILLSQIATIEFWKASFSNIASAILVAGILTAIDEKLIKDNLVELILDKLNLKRGIDQTGIEEVFTDISEIDYKYYFKYAKRSIDIIHVYGRTWTSNNEDEIKDKLLNSNCNIRVIIASPESPFINGLAFYYGMTPDKLKYRIEEVTTTWKKIYAKKISRRKTESTLELYYHKGQPSYSLYRFDDKIVTVHNKVANSGKTKKLPTIVCKNTRRQDDLYSSYLDEINELVLQSEKVNLE